MLLVLAIAHFFYICMINILRQMKEFLVKLMKRLQYFIRQSIDWYYIGWDESIFFFLFLFLEKTAFDLVFCSLQRDSTQVLLVNQLLEQLQFVRWFVKTSFFADGVRQVHIYHDQWQWSSTSGMQVGHYSYIF